MIDRAYSTSLRTRVAASFVAMSVLLSALFALVVFIAFEVMIPLSTDRLMEENLERVAAAEPASWPLEGDGFVGWSVPPASSRELPAFVRDLEPGLYSIETEERSMEIVIRRAGERLLIVVVDEETIELMDQRLGTKAARLLIAGVLLMSLLALWAGLGTSNRIIAPVKELAEQVRLRSEDPSALPFEVDFAQDEVGELARVFESYSDRLLSFIEREKHFTADVAHELRTGLSVIDNTSELLLGSIEDPSSAEKLMRIRRAALRLQRTVHLLLLLAREAPEGGIVSPRLEALPLLREVLRERLDGRSKPEVEIREDGQLFIAAEEAVLVSLFGNLIDNAVRHARGRRLEIVTGEDFLEVKDDGHGMEAQELERIFNRRYRGPGASGGEGLGLSIVQRLCQHFDWRVEIESEIGRGTRARVEFSP